MRQLAITLVSLVVGLAPTTARTAADEPRGEAKPQNPLVGSWTLVSARYGGQGFRFPEGTTHIKHVTPTQFMWATYDRDGKVTRAAGGNYTLRDDLYSETPEYGLGEDFEIVKGKAQSFKFRVEGNRWHHDGTLSNGLTIEEVWERTDSKAH
jgi:hypothetical protein